MPQVCETYTKDLADKHLNEGKIVIFGGGDTLELRGKILGGIGVSGGSAEQDTALSAYGATLFAELTR
jgi:uncharacterized protein GlcG (DUF336 family)